MSRSRTSTPARVEALHGIAQNRSPGASPMYGVAVMVEAMVRCVYAALALVSGCGSERFGDAASDAGQPPMPVLDGAVGDADAGDAQVASALCAGASSALAICDAFDDAAPLGARWDQVLRTNGDAVRIEDECLSPPRCMRASVDVTDAYAGAGVQRGLASLTGIRVRFAVRVASLVKYAEPSTRGGLSPIEVALTPGYWAWIQVHSAPGGAPHYKLFFTEYTDTTSASGASFYNEVELPNVAAFDPKTWVDVAVDMSFAPPAWAKVFVGGSLVLERPLNGGAPPVPVAGRLTVGARNVGKTRGALDLDDVLVEWR